MGDPAGVGAEVVLGALSDGGVARQCHPIVVGSSDVLRKARDVLVASDRSHGRDAGDRPQVDELDLVDLPLGRGNVHRWGEVAPSNGAAAAAFIERAVKMVQDGNADAVVTAPIHKEALRLAGVQFAGHTEMLAHLTGTEDYAMMLVAPSLRVVHVSTHVPLSEAVLRVKRERVATTIDLTFHALVDEGISQPRIAVAGLNPHAGEHGLFGQEEASEIEPAIRDAAARGVEVSGPHPPDTVFARAVRGDFDAVVVMYHDQGHIPAKLLAFDEAVNVTVGLPIIRTSVDHGTAFDIAGTGEASPNSMIAALSYAAKLARTRHQRS